MSRPALFADRDGVVIENRAEYIRTWDDVSIIPGALEALQRASETEHRIVLVTNQSSVGRGLLTLEGAEAINLELVRTLERGGARGDGGFLCPHRPADAVSLRPPRPEAACTCRKPEPGLILQAAAALGLDLAGSLLIGDAVSDLQAGEAAGGGPGALGGPGPGRGQGA